MTQNQSCPRLATSIDDLRVGQVVAWQEASRVEGGVVENYDGELGVHGNYFSSRLSSVSVVILSDPPPEPVTVSREAFDRLAEAQRAWDRDGINPDLRGDVVSAARVLVDEVEGQDQ